MITQSKGKIFLAEERGMKQSDGIRTYNNFGAEQEPFGSLSNFNEETLAGGRTLTITAKDDSHYIIIPIVGSVAYKNASGSKGLLAPGEILSLHLLAGSTMTFENPYHDGLINLLNIELCPEFPVDRNIVQTFRFDLNAHRGLLSNIPGADRKGHNHFKTFPGFAIGKFEGRNEAQYEMSDASKGVFAFVIEGVFEVQGRLLHYRDGLSLWNVNGVIDMEALSNGAIILLLEVTL